MKVYTLNSVPQRIIDLGGAGTCVIGSYGLMAAAWFGDDDRLYFPAAGCAVASLVMLKRAVEPEDLV